MEAPQNPEKKETEKKPEIRKEEPKKKTSKEDIITKLKNIFKKKEKIKTKEAILFHIKPSKEIIQLPELTDEKAFDIKYPLLKPYAYAHIKWNPKEKELIYTIEEPILTIEEKAILSQLEESMKELINISFININESEIVIEYLEKNIKVLLSEFGYILNKESFLKIMYYIYRDFVGLNEIEPLLNDYFIEDIECNGSKTPVYIVHRKYRHLKTNLVFPDNEVLSNLVEKIAQKSGSYISYANPILDSVLPDGSRVNATYTKDITTKGPTFSIRKFTKEPWTPIKLMDLGTVSPEMLAYLWLLTEYGSNIMVIGGTGSGKTSFLNSIAFFIPPKARIITIEDTREINMIHENWLPSVARAGVGLANIVGQKHGEVSLFDLLKESFRQRPDYVIVGEIRGKEAFVMFQGAASGHPTASTMHAESVDTMIKRLETNPINLSPSLVESLDVVCVMIQAKIGRNPVRRIKEIVEIIDIAENGKASTNTPFTRDPAKDKFYFKRQSNVFDKISKKSGIPMEKLINEFNLRTRILLEMHRKKIFGFKEVQLMINEYNNYPRKVMKQLGLIK